MSNLNRKNGAILAAAAAVLFVTTPLAAHSGEEHAEAEGQGQCVGGNSCKGHSACKTASSSCRGQNACRGQGFTRSTKAECDETGGEFQAS